MLWEPRSVVTKGRGRRGGRGEVGERRGRERRGGEGRGEEENPGFSLHTPYVSTSAPQCPSQEPAGRRS